MVSDALSLEANVSGKQWKSKLNLKQQQKSI